MAELETIGTSSEVGEEYGKFVGGGFLFPLQRMMKKEAPRGGNWDQASGNLKLKA